LTEELPGWRTLSSIPLLLKPRERFVGFAYSAETEYKGRSFSVLIPHWFVAGLASLLPLKWIRDHRRRRQRVSLGLCLACGYNLTGNVSGTCPECGTAVRSAETPAKGPIA
jgi:hypothetical protein